LKHARHPFAPLGAASAAALAVAIGASGVAVRAQSAAPSPTAAPTATAAPSPSATPTPRGRGKRRAAPEPTATPAGNPEPTATPTSPAYASLDGTWEVQFQYIDRTDYAYFDIVQTPTGGITGTWRTNGKSYPLEGTYDGRLIHLVAKEPLGNVPMDGYVEGASDMVGEARLQIGKTDETPFTAEHRGSPKTGILKGGN
jgi:hypothetical protein